MGIRKKEKMKEENKKVPFFKLFSFADRYDVLLMMIGTLGAIGYGMQPPLMTVIFGRLIDTLGTSNNDTSSSNISKVCMMYLYLAMGVGVASFLQVACWSISGERQSIRIRGLYLKAILGQDIEFFDTQTTTGEVIGRMSSDTIIIRAAIGEMVGRFLQLLTTFVGGLLIAFIRGWRLSLMVSLCIPLLVVSSGCITYTLSRTTVRLQAAYAQAGNVVKETVGAIKTVASFNGEKQAISKYEDKLEIAYSATTRQGLITGVGSAVSSLVSCSSYGLAIWYGSKLILQEKDGYNGGEVISIIMAIIFGASALGWTSPCLSSFARGRAAAYTMYTTINRKPKIYAYDEEGIVLDDIKGEIELKDVHFTYPSRPDVQILSGFSLHIPSGMTAALVGPSGNGKSTVISLLQRFYDPQAGEVLIDGVKLNEFQLKWIRSKISLVSQEPILFATTIRENMLYGKENATTEEIELAIELAHASDFINKLPQRLDTMVGEHGTQLSGGQKQRIAIARAVLKNPRILLLDEATSALDAESERVVQNALDTVMATRTTVIIAHRLSTIRNAAVIAVVQAGKLLEKGNHEELMKDPNGAYAQLVQMQHRKIHQTEEKEDVVDIKLADIQRSVSHGSSRRSSADLSSPVNTPETGVVGDDKEIKGHKSVTSVPIKRIMHLQKPELLILFIGSIAAVVNGLIFPVYGLLMSSAIKIFYEPPNKLHKDSKFWAVMFVSLGFSNLISLPVKNYLFGVAGGKLITRIRSLSFQKIVHQEMSWFDKPQHSSGKIGAKLATDATTIRTIVGDALATVVQNVATMTGGVVLAFTANWILAVVILILLPLTSLQGFLQMRFYKKIYRTAKKMYEEASQVASDAVGSIRTVASFGAEEKIINMYQKKCEKPMKQAVKTGIISGAGFGFSAFALFSTTSFCFYIGSVLQKHGRITFAEIFRVFFCLSTLSSGLSQMATLFSDWSRATISVASIFEILDSKPMIDSSIESGTTLDQVKGDIELRHVTFKYPTRPDFQVFKDLSLTMPSGKTVALVGESGSGKSTIISLMQRFYDPDSGHIYLDGINIQTFKLSWLRQQFGLVSQEPILFNDTIRANVGYGKQGGATEEEIIEATKTSNSHNFISALPQGYDTTVGERGIQMSGGQKQRIAIARAILKDPKVLLLDEATSALDAESEHVVQDALDNVMVGRTTVVVAHRLSTIEGADMIAVVKNGVIAEKGRHDELLSIKGGVYASLVALQTNAV